MSRIAMVFGIVLILLGPITYFPAPVEHRSPTAFIPSLVGIILVVCGWLALNPGMRMHAMHAAVTVALLGFLASGGRLLMKAVQGAAPTGLALIAQAAMALLCLVFVILCVQSFIAARKARTES